MRPENKLEIQDTIVHLIEGLKDLKGAVEDEDATVIDEHYEDVELAYDLLPFLLSGYLNTEGSAHYPMRPDNELEIQDTIVHLIEGLKDLKGAVEDEDTTAMNEHYKNVKLAYKLFQSTYQSLQ